MIEYTNSLKLEIDNAKEHVALMTTAQETLIQNLEDQKKAMLAQQTKFVEMMNNVTTKTDEERRQRKPTEGEGK